MNSQTESFSESSELGSIIVGVSLAQYIGTTVLLWAVLGPVRALLVAGVVTLISWLLGYATGLIPVLGQVIYGRFADAVIFWVFAQLGLDRSLSWEAPKAINFILEWILDFQEIKGSLQEFAYATGNAISVILSVLIVYSLVRKTASYFRTRMETIWLLRDGQIEAKRQGTKIRPSYEILYRESVVHLSGLTLGWFLFYCIAAITFLTVPIAFTPFGGLLWSGKIDVLLFFLIAGLVGGLIGYRSQGQIIRAYKALADAGDDNGMTRYLQLTLPTRYQPRR